ILVEGADAPDVLARAVDVAVVAGKDMEAVPGAARCAVQGAGQSPLQGHAVPGAVLGEGLQSLPIAGPADADEGLGDGVLLDVEGQAGDPLGEATPAGTSEAGGEGGEQRLPQRP